MVQSMQFHTDSQNLEKYFYLVRVRFDILTKKKRSFKYFFFFAISSYYTSAPLILNADFPHDDRCNLFIVHNKEFLQFF